MTAGGKQYLFVYGTLRGDVPNNRNHLLHNVATYHRPGKVRGSLYDLGSYPGLVSETHSRRWVQGEIYLLKNSQLALDILDEYEGCAPHQAQPHEYSRELIRVHCKPRGTLHCWVYCYRLQRGRTKIMSGDYGKYLLAKR